MKVYMIKHRQTRGMKRVVIEESYGEAVKLIGWDPLWCILQKTIPLSSYLSNESKYQKVVK